MKILIAILLIALNAGAQTIVPSRTTDWYVAGHVGAIPNPTNVVDVTTFGGVGDSLTNNHTAIVNAINSLAGHAGVIYFPPGNYLIQSTLTLPDSVVIRGASSDSTHLIFDFGGVAGNSFTVSGSGGPVATSVLSGFVKGSSSITVADASAYSAGDYAEIQEVNGTWDTAPVSWADHSVGQIIRIDSFSTDTLFFHQPLRITYDSALSVTVQKFIPKKEIGIECLSMLRRDSVSSGLCIGVYFFHAVNCWIRGVESNRSVGSHFEADNSAHIEITGCHVHHSYAYDGVSTHGYGITLFKHTCESKLENNVMQHLRHSFSMQCGANGNVIGYNYSIDPNRSEFPSNAGADISMHGHYSYCNLFEGNIVQNLQIDQTWGPTGPLNTFFRNRIELYGLVMSSGTMQSDSQNFVGNEIPNTGPLMGMYTLYGAGHFEYGNNVRGTITPAATTNLPDASYYLSAQPSFWNIASPFPPIGEPNVSGSGSIPAKARFILGSGFTMCSEDIPLGIAENNFGNLIVFPNPGSVFTVVGLPPSEKVRIEILNTWGQTVFSKQCPNHATIDLGKFSAGIYFLKISDEKGFVVKRIIRQ